MSKNTAFGSNEGYCFSEINFFIWFANMNFKFFAKIRNERISATFVDGNEGFDEIDEIDEIDGIDEIEGIDGIDGQTR